LETETLAASTEVLCVKARGLFVREEEEGERGWGGCVSRVKEGRGGAGGGRGVRTSSLPDGDAVRAAMAVPLWRAYNTPTERWREREREEGESELVHMSRGWEEERPPLDEKRRRRKVEGRAMEG